MPTAIAGARQYARGSRLAQSLVQGDPGPSLFLPGTVTPESSVVKLAHSILAYGSQKRAREQMEVLAADEQEKSDLQLQLLRQRTDPNYMNAYQRDSLKQRAAVDAAPKTATPRAKVHLGEQLARFYGLGGEGDYDPTLVSAAKGRVTEMRLDQAAKDANTRAAEAKAGAQRYTKANAELLEYDRERGRAADAAEAAMREDVERKRAMLKDNTVDGATKRQAREFLRALDKKRPGETFEDLVRKTRRHAESYYDSTNASRRRLALQVIQRESGTLGQGTGDPLMDLMRQEFDNPDDEE